MKMTVPAIPVSTASARMALMSINVCVLQDTQVCFNHKKMQIEYINVDAIISSVLDAHG